MGFTLTEHLAEDGVVQVRVLQGQALPLVFGPHHEGVHRPSDPLLAARCLPVARRHASRGGHVWTLPPRAEGNPGLGSPPVRGTGVPRKVLIEPHVGVGGGARGPGRPGAPEGQPGAVHERLSGQAALR